MNYVVRALLVLVLFFAYQAVALSDEYYDERVAKANKLEQEELDFYRAKKLEELKMNVLAEYTKLDNPTTYVYSSSNSSSASKGSFESFQKLTNNNEVKNSGNDNG